MTDTASAKRARRLGRQQTGPWEYRFPLFVFAVHWVVIQSAAWFALRFGTPNSDSAPYGQMPLPMTGWQHWLVEPFRQWDGLWYALISRTGYDGVGQTARAAFWPLYPLLMELGHRLTGLPPETVGYFISNIAFAIALILIFRLVRHDFEEEIARGTLWALALFPTAFFFQSVYTESLFLVLAAAALLAAREDRWWLAGIIGAFAALTRSYGVLLGIPFAVMLWQEYGWNLRRWFPRAFGAALPALGPLAFGWWLERVQGNWRAFIDVQGQWNRYSAMPWDTLRCAWNSCMPIPGIPDGATWDWLPMLLANPAVVSLPEWRKNVADSDTLELVVTLAFLALALIGIRLLPPWQSAYVIPALVIPLFSPSQVHALMSMPRFVLPLFPLFTVLALLVRPGPVGRILLVVSTVFLFLLTVQFAQWYWVS